jgi:hypothetical protein
VFAILNVKHRYGELVDHLSHEVRPELVHELGELFEEDVFVDFGIHAQFGHVVLRGRDAVKQLYGGDMQGDISWTWHSFHSPIAPDGPAVISLGRYNDEFVRGASAWRISSMRLTDESKSGLYRRF